jgi:hypothetical protein
LHQNQLKQKEEKREKKQHQNSDVEWWFWHPNLQEKTQNSIETKILEHQNFEKKKFGIEILSRRKMK